MTFEAANIILFSIPARNVPSEWHLMDLQHVLAYMNQEAATIRTINSFVNYSLVVVVHVRVLYAFVVMPMLCRSAPKSIDTIEVCKYVLDVARLQQERRLIFILIDRIWIKTTFFRLVMHVNCIYILCDGKSS